MNCEIEFLPVGEGSKPGDAIVVRYGEPNHYELMIVDGGTTNSGKEMVKHVRAHFGQNAVVSHVVLTHADADHASGLREILRELPVTNLWLHAPWAHAAAARPYFANKNWTDDGLAEAIFKEYDIVAEIIELAENQKTVTMPPFAGTRIGPFVVLSPLEPIYPILMAQFDKTPAPDEAAIKATGFWIGKQPGVLAKVFEKMAAKVQNWIPETWQHERLKDGGTSSASNESSVVLYGDFGPKRRVLLTGDAGILALTSAAMFAEKAGLALQDFMFVQVPHHGSRRNVGPTILNRLLGPIVPEGSETRFHAYVSAPPDDDTHPRKIVTNAFRRRGAEVAATQGVQKVFGGGFPPRPNYNALTTIPFATAVEDYD